MFSSIWVSIEERRDRVKHAIQFTLGFLFLLFILSFINAPSIETLKPSGTTLRWIFSIVLIAPGIVLVYKSLDELLVLIIPPYSYSKSRIYRIILTGITLGPLLFLGVDYLASAGGGNSEQKNGDNGKSKEAIGYITHYFGFQLYFLGINWVGWKFINKFLLFDLPEQERIGLKRTGGKLLRWHFLGWSSFFLLALFFPIWVIITCLCLSFFNNSLSFVFGRYFGRLRLSKFSSSKTVEGLIGSVVASLLFFRLFVFWIFSTSSFKHSALSCDPPQWLLWIWVLGASLIIHYGDQTFSVCKRVLGYKNFGRFFGRQIGGFWDRFDSLAPTLVFSSILIWIFYAVTNSTIGIP